MARRAKIVCTLGPAVLGEGGVLRLVEAGMDVARLNLSHGTHADHARAYRMVRAAGDRSGRAVAVLADLSGPKVRLRTFADPPVVWRAGDRVTLTTEDVVGSRDRVSCTYAGLADDVVAGDRVLVADGELSLRVEDVEGPDVRCVVVDGGEVSDGKGVNLPGVAVSEPALTAKDEEDLRFALGLRVDMVALSFVRSPADLDRVREILAERDASDVPVLAKIEKPEAVEVLEEVITAADGVMVARGDLGVEMALSRVPLVQKLAVRLAREQAKPVIVATQVLDSMISHPRPTRAEVSDAANAVLDGCDALMLSGETAVGRHPYAAVDVLDKVLAAVEDGAHDAIPPMGADVTTLGGAIAQAAVDIADRLDGVKALVVFSQTGSTARRVARHRPKVPLLTFTPVPAVRSRMALQWGVETFLTPTVHSTDAMVRLVERQLLELGRARKGDLVVVVAGFPVGTPGYTNALRVHRLGDLIGVEGGS